MDHRHRHSIGVGLLKAIKRYYDLIDQQIREDQPANLHNLQSPIAVMPLQRRDRLAEKAVRHSLTLSSDVVTIHLTKLEGSDAKEHLGRLRQQWRDDVERPAQEAGLTPPELIISPSPYRSFAGRLLKHISEIEALRPNV
jgi:hypothetical protein